MVFKDQWNKLHLTLFPEKVPPIPIFMILEAALQVIQLKCLRTQKRLIINRD